MTQRCLQSVKNSLGSQTYPVFLVDNGSTNGVMGKTCPDDIRLESNQGFSRGMNAALKHAFAKEEIQWCLLLSNDTELPKDFYMQLLPSLRSDTRKIYCPEVYYLSDRTKPAYTHGTLDLEQFKLSHHFDEHCDEILFPNYYPAAVTIWGREAWNQLQGFNENYFCYWEDVELSHRCTREKIPLCALHTVRVHHLGQGTTKGKSNTASHFDAGREMLRRAVIK
jgi:GT2 family glycosyltransferase